MSSAKVKGNHLHFNKENYFRIGSEAEYSTLENGD